MKKRVQNNMKKEKEYKIHMKKEDTLKVREVCNQQVFLENEIQTSSEEENEFKREKLKSKLDKIAKERSRKLSTEEIENLVSVDND